MKALLWRQRSNHDDGFTLVELLIATTLMVIIVTALVGALMLALRTSVGLSNTATVSGQDRYLISQQIDSHIAVQDLSRAFTSDIENANDNADVAVAPAATLYCVAPAGSSLGIDTVLASIQLHDGTSAGSVTDRIAYVYSTNSLKRYAQIARYDCTGGSTSTASYAVIARGLSSTTATTASAAAPTASVPSWVYTLTMTTVSGRVYTISATPAVTVSSPGGGGGAGSTPPPPFSDMDMRDVDHDGKIDRIVVTYDASVTLTNACASSWSLQGTVPSGGTLDTANIAVSNASHTITLPITEGSGPADTTTGGMTVQFSPASGCSLLAFSNIIPIDDAPPVLLSVVSGSQPTGGTPGKMEIGDSVALTFSEPLDPSTIPTDVTVAESAGANGNDMLSITGRSGTPSAGRDLTAAPVDMGTKGYLSNQSKVSAAYAGVVSLDSATAPSVVTVTIPATVTNGGAPVPNTCTGGTLTDCALLSPGVGTMSFNPASNLKSLVQSPQATSTAITPVVTLGGTPAPGANFGMF